MIYDQRFFEGIRRSAEESARVIVPLVTGLISPRSVLDVGCGDGTWLDAYRRLGVADYFGVDGDYVRKVLRVPTDRFAARDLSVPFDLGRRFDLVQSLEVAEHLTPDAAEGFIESLVRHGDTILFSAAVPGQGGTGHLNEQWPDYWGELFLHAGFAAYDWVRPQVWTDQRVAWWYAQNALLFVRNGLVSEWTRRLPSPAPPDSALRRLHPQRDRPTPAVSVVMPVFNGAPFLDRSITSLRAQTFPGWELLAVDDGSSDDSYAILVGWAAVDPRVRVLRHKANRGLSAARNTALAVAGGELIAYLDCDDEFYPDHLARVWECRARGDVFVFRYDFVDDRPGGGGQVTTYNPEDHLGALVSDTLAVPLGVTHRRALIGRVGGFDERLGRYRGLTEDAELWRRFARAGALFAFIAHRSGRYHIRSDSLARTQPPPPAGHSATVAEPVRLRIAPSSPAASILPRTAAAELGVTPRPVESHPRVLFASYHCFHDPASGAARCTRDLFDQLTTHGWTCAVFTGPNRDDDRAPPINEQLAAPDLSIESGRVGSLAFTTYFTDSLGYPVTVFAPDLPAVQRPPSPVEARTFANRLGRVVRAFRPDVVLTYGGDPASRLVPPVARSVGAKVIFWLHNLSYGGTEFFRDYDNVIVPSAFARDHYRSAANMECVILPPVLEPGQVVAASSPERKRYATFVNPEPAKGATWFARLAEVLCRVRPDLPLLVVEGRGHIDWLGRCGIDLSATQSIHRMENTADPRWFYRVSRVMLMPSLVGETFGRVAAEAQINGIPVLASDRGALPDTVGAGGVILPIPPHITPSTSEPPTADEVAPWVEAVIRIWEDPVWEEHLVQATRQAALRWHPEVIVPQWEEFVTRMAARD